MLKVGDKVRHIITSDIGLITSLIPDENGQIPVAWIDNNNEICHAYPKNLIVLEYESNCEKIKELLGVK